MNKPHLWVQKYCCGNWKVVGWLGQDKNTQFHSVTKTCCSNVVMLRISLDHSTEQLVSIACYVTACRVGSNHLGYFQVSTTSKIIFQLECQNLNCDIIKSYKSWSRASQFPLFQKSSLHGAPVKFLVPLIMFLVIENVMSSEGQYVLLFHLRNQGVSSRQPEVTKGPLRLFSGTRERRFCPIRWSAV